MATHAAGYESKSGPMKGREKKSKKELDHIRIHKAENGGHIVEHHFSEFDQKPEPHVFGKDEGPELLDHVADHMGIESGTPDDEDEDEE